MRRIVIAALSFLMSVPLTAATVRGTVLVKDSRLPGTTVTLRFGETVMTTVSDADGAFSFQNVPVSDAMLTAEFSGLRNAKTTFRIKESDSEVALTLKMKLRRADDSIVIVCGPPRYDQGSVFTMYRNEADKLPIGH